MFGLLLTITACQTSAPTAAVDLPDPEKHFPALKEGLDEALLMWQGAQPEQAQALLEQTYHAHFELFEAPLRAYGIDPLQIEYDFGRIGWRMRRAPSTRRSDAEELSGLLLLLEHDIEEALAALPAATDLHQPR